MVTGLFYINIGKNFTRGSNSVKFVTLLTGIFLRDLKSPSSHGRCIRRADSGGATLQQSC